MKGLSVEEKAKRYNEAIERAKGLIDFCSDSELKTLEHVFPELKESEDERMRNVAINACKYMVDNFENSTKQYEDAIAWLEKQGEQKPAEWSEEDENLFRCAIDAVREESKVRTDGCLDEEVGEMVIDWLKSLRPQNTWKPSDRELGAMLIAIGDERQKGSDVAKELLNIYQQLKKLREE